MRYIIASIIVLCTLLLEVMRWKRNGESSVLVERIFHIGLLLFAI